ncbi:MAG: SMC-Scp complex subunit ScpB [Alphaproteobacteria bacterium]
MTENNQNLRLLEALIYASTEPVSDQQIANRLPEGTDVGALVAELQAVYEHRGVHLVRVANGWAFRTAPDLAGRLQIERTVTRKLSRAAVETLAIIAYHQPITRAEIEEVRGVAQSKGTLEVLLEMGWIAPGRRRHTPGRPVTWMTTRAFLDHFGLADTKDLPGIAELKAAGFLDARPAIQAFRAEETEAKDEPGDEGQLEFTEPLAEEDEDAPTAEEIARELDSEEPPRRGADRHFDDPPPAQAMPGRGDD